MKPKYTLIQVIGLLKLHPNYIFQRVNDLKFEIFKGNYNDLMYRINSKSEEFRITKQLPIFSYLQDLFILKEDS